MADVLPPASARWARLVRTFAEHARLAGFGLDLNSLGDPAGRPAYHDALRSYREAHAADLSDQSRQTLALNPLRVLDSKRPEDAPIIEAAPKMLDYLSPAAEAHFDRVRA